MVTTSSINHQSIHLFWEIRRKAEEQHKRQLKLSNPNLLKHIEAIYDESPDMKLCELIEQFFCEMEHPLATNLAFDEADTTPPPPKKERYLVYRGQKIAI